MSIIVIVSHQIIKSNKKYQDMRLTHLAIIAIKGSDDMVSKLAKALDVSPPTIYKYIREKSDDLTKAAALKVIREETGLIDEQILEEVSESEARA
jgi:AcrR family transcriptional regulator